MAGSDKPGGGMARFYWRLAKSVPGLLWTAGNRVLTCLTLLVALATAANREWAEAITQVGAGISPAWGFLPVGLLVLYGLLRANYREVARLRKTAHDLDLSVSVSRLRVLEPLPDSTEEGLLIVINSVRLTNRSPEHQVSLGISFQADAFSGHIQLNAVSKGTLELPESAIFPPLTIGSQDSEAGLLAFRLGPLFANLFGENPDQALERRGEKRANARLLIEDFVSDRSITVPVPGDHP